MATVKTHDLKDFALVFGPKVLSGFGDGAAINIEYQNQRYETVFGADGEPTRIRHNAADYAQVTITLMSTSESNNDMAAIAILDRLANGAPVPFAVRHLRGGETYTAEQAYIQGNPSAEISDGVTAREWIIECPVLLPSGYGVGA